MAAKVIHDGLKMYFRSMSFVSNLGDVIELLVGKVQESAPHVRTGGFVPGLGLLVGEMQKTCTKRYSLEPAG